MRPLLRGSGETISQRSTGRACLVACALIATAALAPSANAADTCDVLYNAGIKSVQTPHRVYSTRTTRAGKVQTGEAIFAGGAEFLLRDDKWMRSPMPQSRMIAAAQEKLKTHSDTCTLIADRVVGGQTVSVYKAHNNEVGSDQTVRISKSSGLLQGATLTLPDGGSVETRYEYDKVQAPPGVN